MTPAAIKSAVPKHIITINVEDYFQVGAFKTLIPFSHWERFDVRIKTNTETTLALLEASATHATFFTSGWIAQNYPEILRAIVDAGHEIACQGYYQQSIRDIAPQAFRDDLKRSRQAVEDATGIAVQGFRVGRGRIGPDDLWALDILAEENFRYDASLSPIGRQFNQHPSRLRLHLHESAHGELWEVPVSATSAFGWAIPFSGGNYIRQMPAWLIREAVARWVERRDAPLVMYFHVWELDQEQPVISGASWLQRIRHYRNLKDMPQRIGYFLEHYRFTSIADYLGLAETAAQPVTEPRTTVHAEPAVPAVNVNAAAVRKISIVIPCYNEEASIAYLDKTLANFKQSSRQLMQPNFIFVDDGSLDTTWEKLHRYFGQRADCQLVQHAKNRGIAAAILTGIAHAKADLIAVLDADCTFDPMQLNEMVPMLRDDVAIVAASPLHAAGNIANVPGWRLLLSKGAAFLYRCVLNQKLTSYTSCFRVYRREAVSGLKIYKQGFCGVAEILARLDLAGYKIVECPAELETRLLGQSKINLVKTIFDHLQLIGRLGAARWLHIPLPDGRRD